MSNKDNKFRSFLENKKVSKKEIYMPFTPEDKYKNPVNKRDKFDVAVIGGGPAGMIAAIRAGELGAKVILLEKNQNLGRKLLITGKGRCNITQAEFDDKEFVKKLRSKNAKFLFSALSFFGPQEVVDFFEIVGVKTKAERGGRIFPVSEKSLDILNALMGRLKRSKVKIMLGAEVERFQKEGKRIKCVDLKLGTKPLSRDLVPAVFADKFILATGGKAYPLTGSTGDGYSWAENLGHKIIPPSPALVPIRVKEEWPRDLQGLSLKNIEANLIQNNKKQDSRFGEMIFTHFGISGPIILDLSKRVGELLKSGEVAIKIDLKPALDEEKLDKRLQRDFENMSNKDFKNYLPELLPQKMIALIIKLSGIEEDKKLHSITREERKNLGRILKNLRLTVESLMGYDQAIVTSGGVDLREIDSKTMQSKLIENLFFAGEIIDLDGPTGGYNLQICWSTGYVAGENACGKIKA